MKSYNTLDEKKQFFKTAEVTTFDELMSLATALTEKGHYVFRGINEAKYMLYSSAQVRTEALLSQEDYVTIIDNAIRFVRQSGFLMDYIRSCSEDETDFQILALMQHYGCGTPILDYTTDFDSALFFATDRQGASYPKPSLKDKSINDYISIYFFDLNDPNHCSVQQFTERGVEDVRVLDAEARKDYGEIYKGISLETQNSFYYLPFAEMAKLDNGGLFSVLGHSNGIIEYDLNGKRVVYDIDNERVDAQDGLFLFNGLSKTSYEEAAKNWYSDIENYCINIHKSIEGDIINYLNKKGINRTTIYPQSCVSKRIINELINLPMDDRLKPKQ